MNSLLVLAAASVAALSLAQDVYVKPRIDKNGRVHEGYYRKCPTRTPTYEQE